jgi:hypothetical protein
LELDPRVADLSAELRRSAIEQWGDKVDLETLEYAAAPVTAELRRLSASLDLLLAGCFVDVVPAEEERVEPLVLSATVLLALSPEVGGLAEIRGGLAARTEADLRIVTVGLPAGGAVLAAGGAELRRPEWTEAVPAVFERYFVPVPGLGRAAVLSFLTPNVDMADDFSSVFRAIAESLTFDAADQSTVGI